jgi:hypothetical protein
LHERRVGRVQQTKPPALGLPDAAGRSLEVLLTSATGILAALSLRHWRDASGLTGGEGEVASRKWEVASGKGTPKVTGHSPLATRHLPLATSSAAAALIRAKPHDCPDALG